MVLILIHHLVKAKNSGQVDDLLLGRIGQSLLVLLAHIDSDLLLGVEHLLRLRWRNPFFATNRALDEGLNVGDVGSFESLLVDVLDEFLAVEWSRWILGAFVARTLTRWEK